MENSLDEEVKAPFSSDHAIDYVDKIEEMFEAIPDKRKKTEYATWRTEINRLIEEVNRLSKFKMYNTVK